MTKRTIQLVPVDPDEKPINLILRGNTILLNGVSYGLSDFDNVRLLMFCQDHSRRAGMREKYGVRYSGCCDEYRDNNLAINRPEPKRW